MKIRNLLNFSMLATLAACGGGSSKESHTVTVQNISAPSAIIEAVRPASNYIRGTRAHSVTIVGQNLLGVSFAVNDVPCEHRLMTGPPGPGSTSSPGWKVNVVCDIPDTDQPTVMLKAITSTNGSDISRTPSVPLQLAPAGLTPAITSVSPGSVAADSDVDFEIQGTAIGAFNGNRDGAGITWGGASLSCYAVVSDLNTDNTRGRISGCKAPGIPGTNVLKWYYDLEHGHVEFGNLEVTP